MCPSSKNLFILYDLIQNGDTHLLESHLQQCSSDINRVVPCKGIGILHLAVGIEPEEKSQTCTEIILKHGGDPNLCSDEGITPVHIAAIWGRLDNLKLLLASGGDPTQQDEEGHSALDYAALEQQWATYDYLQNTLHDNWMEDDRCCYSLELERILVSTGPIVAEYGIVKEDQIKNISLCRKSDRIRDWCEKTSLAVNKLYPTILGETYLLDNESVPWKTGEFTTTNDFNRHDQNVTRFDQNVTNVLDHNVINIDHELISVHSQSNFDVRISDIDIPRNRNSREKEISLNSDNSRNKISKTNQIPNKSVLNETENTYKTCLSKKFPDISGVEILQQTIDEESSSCGCTCHESLKGLSSKKKSRLSVYENFSLPGSPTNVIHRNYNTKSSLKKKKCKSIDKPNDVISDDSILTEDNSYVDYKQLNDALAIVQNETNEWLSNSSGSNDSGHFVEVINSSNDSLTNSNQNFQIRQRTQTSDSSKRNPKSRIKNKKKKKQSPNKNSRNHNSRSSSDTINYSISLNLSNSNEQNINLNNSGNSGKNSADTAKTYTVSGKNLTIHTSEHNKNLISGMPAKDNKCQRNPEVSKNEKYTSGIAHVHKSPEITKDLTVIPAIHPQVSRSTEVKSQLTAPDNYTSGNQVVTQSTSGNPGIVKPLLELRLSGSSGVSSASSGSIALASVAEEYRYEDQEENVVLIEKRNLVASVVIPVEDSASSGEQEGNGLEKTILSVASSLPPAVEYDVTVLRAELLKRGFKPGPISSSTISLYLKKLHSLRKHPIIATQDGQTYSIELQKSLRDPNWNKDLTPYIELETKARLDFGNSNKTWREGNTKTSFTYLLLEPRVTCNLPARAASQDPHLTWSTFVKSIFYVGKGKSSRPFSHLYQALTLWKGNIRTSKDKKVHKILEIWSSGVGVICLQVFHNIIPAEAFTYEAAMIDVIGVNNLKNVICGNYYGVSASWSLRERRMLGLYLLHKAMLIFLGEGERQLRPNDI